MVEPFIKALIVDDEPPARLRIKMLLQDMEEISLVGECSDGYQAAQSIIELRPDLVFLDVQMPELNGFDVIKIIGHDKMPAVIFVTAYDEYALKAFDVHAVDYLLKPFDRDRFEAAVRRAVKDVITRRRSGSSTVLEKLLADLPDRNYSRDRILIKTSSRISILRCDQIDWVESAGNYVKLHTGKEIHLLRETMKRVEERLDPNIFVRVHRQSIVNIERIRELHPYFHGDYKLILQDGTRLTLSRRYRRRLTEVIGRV